jgi:hypothetical protein
MDTPQQLSREAIEEFKTIYRADFGEAISNEEAKMIALRLLHFLAVLQPIVVPSSREV